ncbi:hypothetical protein RYH73_11065 [Olivibacter sp. CPCC 100613]|uniref:hypothetical protein n=1 Tax=Olivibacter sp. CPCC 100613 TaxID=3079931 RepID=UPI002FF9024D
METYINIAIPIILALFAGVGWLYRHEKERRLLVERQLSEKKYQVYIKFVNLFFELYENQKFKKSMSEQEMFKTMIEMRRDMGSPKTKITTTSFLRSLVKEKNEYENLRKSGVV